MNFSIKKIFNPNLLFINRHPDARAAISFNIAIAEIAAVTLIKFLQLNSFYNVNSIFFY